MQSNIHTSSCFKNIFSCLDECDGVIHGSSAIYEPQAYASWVKWYGDRPIIAAGPQAQVDDAAIELEATKSPIGRKVKSFLDNALQRHGERSLVYVRTRAALELRFSLTDVQSDCFWDCVLDFSTRKTLGNLGCYDRARHSFRTYPELGLVLPSV